ncbi:MAG: hypothetical protein KZQ88_10130 [Candidatus Thiodiazotropha sp. (ex Dulcina madagascariensis)]|nr:hypothetical protein [Candidatus Thiodiazotropha sp. (ex Dulcina madagascariensis)]MCU7928383.1 hypothetical protein [Candidatus Thiodiazotropha sp. (ex Dulcina madagascariensis)]
MKGAKKTDWIGFMVGAVVAVFFVSLSIQAYLNYLSIIAPLLTVLYFLSAFLLGWMIYPKDKTSLERIERKIERSSYTRSFIIRNRSLLGVALYLIVTAPPFFLLLDWLYA